MKRVLVFSLAYYPNFVGGAEVAIKEITDRIADVDLEEADRKVAVTGEGQGTAAWGALGAAA